ncbi:DENN domain-containing protein 1B [Engraulis encrasicolus]|uniref:DENN domain-containing protein 1B n=1 Tax=Engraulis encrasicolus TaxID=184585 RepID=UPI002FD39C83
MDSRINEKPDRTFDLVLQVACPSSENEDPAVIWRFPQDYTDQEVLQTVPKFCFPFDVERVSQNQVGQNFTFVLTDIESKQRFGFCRLTSGCRVCICLLSYLPWFEIYYKLLNTLADYLTKHQEDDLNDMLETLHSLPVPRPNTPVNLSVTERLHIAMGQVANTSGSKGGVHSYFIAPDINGLPTIPESRNLTEYFVAVDVTNMLQLYASMLYERRIIITSSKLSTLTACVHGSASMLFPMYWQHIYIPVLPPHLLDYCCAPMPYLIGVHLSLMERVRSRSLEDVVILNVDTNTLESPSDDLKNLPSDVVYSLKSKLKKQSTATGSGVARAFLRTQATLFGSYRDALRYRPGEPITFCEESFVAHRSSSMRSFLETAVNAQLFKQFIDGRLAKLNAGRGFTDLFEEEITEGGFCGSNTRSYQQWMHTVKKGGALFNTAVTKTKSHVKQGFRGMRSRLKQRGEEDDGSCGGGSPTSTKSLSPRRLQKRRKASSSTVHPVSLSCMDALLLKVAGVGVRSTDDVFVSTAVELCGVEQNYDKKLSIGCPDITLDEDEQDNASKISSEDSGEVPSYTEEESDGSYEMEGDVEPPGGHMTLLEEILDSLSSSSSAGPARLSAAKSLDFLRSMEELDYKPTNRISPSSGSQHDCGDSSSVSSASGSVGAGGVFGSVFGGGGGCGSSSGGSVGGSLGRGAEPGAWHMGQDDSAIHGKHLPPSPRRQPSYKPPQVPARRPRAHTTHDDANLCVPSHPPVRSSSHAGSLPPDIKPCTRPTPSPSPSTASQAPHTPPNQTPHTPPNQTPQTPPLLCPSPQTRHKVETSPTPQPAPLLQSEPERDPPAPHSPSPSRAFPSGPALLAAAPAAPTATAAAAELHPGGLAGETQQHPASSRSMIRRRVLSKEKLRQYQEGARQNLNQEGNRQSAALIPWTKDSDGEGDAEREGGRDGRRDGEEDEEGLGGEKEVGLLEEIESMCNLTSTLHTGLQLTQLNSNTDKT